MKIYKNTVSNLLWEVLSKLMTIDELKSFRLVGGTSLSLFCLKNKHWELIKLDIEESIKKIN